MQARTVLTLTREEVQTLIPYGMICETRCGKAWSTSKRRRLRDEEFSPEEKNEAEHLFRTAYAWHLTKGVPDTVEMPAKTLAFWKRLESFCASL